MNRKTIRIVGNPDRQMLKSSLCHCFLDNGSAIDRRMYRIQCNAYSMANLKKIHHPVPPLTHGFFLINLWFASDHSSHYLYSI